MKKVTVLIACCFLLAIFARGQTNIVSAVYFYNTDPGIGLGTTIPITPNDTVVLANFQAPTAGLPKGYNTITIRTKDETGKWSHYATKQFYINIEVVAAEYFYDVDPGFGLGDSIPITAGTSVSVSNFQVPTAGLSNGIHKLFVRGKDSAGKWSHYNSWIVLVNDQQSIVAVEYFYDTDPGIGVADSIPITPGSTVTLSNVSIPTTGLTHGAHRLVIRSKDSSGKWSHYAPTNIFINEQDMIVAAEYFIDTDPGVGAADSIPITPSSNLVLSNISVPTTGLTYGKHSLNIRSKDKTGKWSLYGSRQFEVLPKVISAEAFFDNDLGIGSGIPISFSAGSPVILTPAQVSVVGLTTGTHEAFVRAKDENGKWSHYAAGTFYKCGTTVDISPVEASICLGSSVELTATGSLGGESGSLTYVWAPATGLSTTSGTTTTASPTVTTIYSVTATNATTGCSAQDFITVTVNTAPENSCPSDIVAQTEIGLCGADVSFEATATGSPTPAITYSQNPETFFGEGTTIITATATNVCGSDDCTFNITVNDEELPAISCPGDLILTADAGQCYAAGVILGAPTTSDNCGVADTDNNAPSPFPVGTTVVTWTVTDVNGNENTCLQSVTVNDNENPGILCPADVNVTADAGDCFASGVALGSPTTNDNCGIFYVENDAPATFPVGTTNVTWTVTDIHGNSAQCIQHVGVTDDEDPTIDCPDDLNLSADAGECFASGVVLGSPITDDNCGVFSVLNNAPATFPVGTTNVIWTVTDIHGNTAQCIQQVVVTDDENPTIDCPDDLNLSADAGECFASSVALGSAITDDNCGVFSVMNDAPATFPVGTTNVTWIVTDVNGNTAQCVQQVVVTDDENPTIDCPDDLNLSADAGECFASSVALGSAITDDNCGVFSVVNDAPITFAVGTTNVTWVVTDIHGNIAQCVQQVVVTDDENPTIDCPDDVSVFVDPGVCYASNVALGSPITEDNCGVFSVTNDAPSLFPAGTTTVIWTVADIHGNTAQCTQEVEVIDNRPPMITCPPTVSVTADVGECFASGVALGTPETSDNCGVFSVVNNAPATFPVGTTNVTWIVTDVNGNTAQCIQQVVVMDDENPTIDCPIDLNLSADAGECSASGVVLGTPITADNCGVFSAMNSAPSTFQVGMSTVTWTVTDIHGNTATCEQIVVVTDDEDPTIDCPDDLNLSADDGECFASSVVLGSTITDDNCGVFSVVNDAPATFPVGSTTVTWTVTDIHGNTAQCVQQVVVTDDENPTIDCPDDLNLSADAGECFASSVVLGSTITDDNCGVFSVVNDAPATFQVGTTTVTWTVTDIHGNTSSCTQDVVVTDDENPTIDCPDDLNLSADAGECFASSVVLGSAITDDNCGVFSVVNDAPVTFPVGTTTVTWTVTDIHGNTATCEQIVVVTDDENPTIDCPDDMSLSADAGECFASSVVLGSAITDDNCGVFSVVNDAPVTFPVGTTTVTWTVTDIHGNTSTCTQDVVVTDDENPSIDCPDDLNLSADAGECFASSVALGSAITDDNCGVFSVMNDSPATFPVGTTTVTWTVTDIHGNTSSCTQEVVVSDDENPTIICPDDLNLSADAGECFASSVALGSPIEDDNCGVDEVTNDAPTTYPVGTTMVTWTVTDIHGNTAQCVQIVVVTDDEDPDAVCQDIAIALALDGTASIIAAQVDGGSSDNCGIFSTSVAPDSFDCSDAGPNTVTLTVTDIHGNVSTCEAIVTVTGVFGCTDVSACNYNALVTCEDGSCAYPITLYLDSDGDGFGDLDSPLTACSHPANYVADNSDCDDTNEDVNPGETENLCNGIDDNCDGTIDEGRVDGCTSPLAVNYNPLATCDDGSCHNFGCMYANAVNYEPLALVDDGSCLFAGCTDMGALNYQPSATTDDGSCQYAVYGCMCADSPNYDPAATASDGSCLPASIPGCTNPLALNYHPAATLDDGSCNVPVYGCTYPDSPNYNPAATVDNGTCVVAPNTCPADLDGNGVVNVNDLLLFMAYFGTYCP